MGSNSDFVIENGVLTKYTGPGGEVAIPAGVTRIEDGAFDDCPNLTIHAPAGSYAETYAKENNIRFEAE